MTQPAHKERLGAISATVWKKEMEGKNGKYTVFNTEVVRNYKDGEEWKKTNNFQLNDLPKVEAVTREAYLWIMRNKNSDNDSE